jgi:two-component system, sensor histidine kinase and response regulator
VGVPEDLVGLDVAAALGRVGGDEELLKEISEIFLEQCPEALSEVKDAVASINPEALQCAAHSLKGSIGNFGAKAAFDAALRLEMMGRQGDLSGSAEALSDLEQALVSLKPQLAKLVAS